MAQKHTTIVKYINESKNSIVAFNAENIGNSFWVPAMETVSMEKWISHHKTKPIVMATSKGFCHVWEDDWVIYGHWEHESKPHVLARGREQGVNGKVEAFVNESGDVFLRIAGN